MKIEVGKKYETRDGQILTVWKNDGSAHLSFAVKETEDAFPYYWYNEDGLIGRRDYNEPHDLDLVREITPKEETKASTTPPPPPKTPKIPG